MTRHLDEDFSNIDINNIQDLQTLLNSVEDPYEYIDEDDLQRQFDNLDDLEKQEILSRIALIGTRVNNLQYHNETFRVITKLGKIRNKLNDTVTIFAVIDENYQNYSFVTKSKDNIIDRSIFTGFTSESAGITVGIISKLLDESLKKYPLNQQIFAFNAMKIQQYMTKEILNIVKNYPRLPEP